MIEYVVTSRDEFAAALLAGSGHNTSPGEPFKVLYDGTSFRMFFNNGLSEVRAKRLRRRVLRTSRKLFENFNV